MCKKIIVCLIAIALAFLVNAGCAPQGQGVSAEPVKGEIQTEEIGDDEVVVRVGSEKLTMRQIKYLEPPVRPSRMKSFAEWWVQSLLVAEESKRQGGLTDDPAIKFQAGLEMRKFYNQMFINKLRQSIEVSDDEIDKYYEDNKETDLSLKKPVEYDFFLVTTKTLEEAEEIKQQITEGTDITEVTKAAPDGSEVKKGKLFKRLTRDPIIRQQGQKFFRSLSKAQKGDIIGPTQNPKKEFNVARFEGKQQIFKPFDEKVKKRIKRILLRQKRADVVNNLTTSLKKENAENIHWSPRFLKYAEKLEPEGRKRRRKK